MAMKMHDLELQVINLEKSRMLSQRTRQGMTCGIKCHYIAPSRWLKMCNIVLALGLAPPTPHCPTPGPVTQIHSELYVFYGS